jgi:hypothetical protein
MHRYDAPGAGLAPRFVHAREWPRQRRRVASVCGLGITGEDERRRITAILCHERQTADETLFAIGGAAKQILRRNERHHGGESGDVARNKSPDDLPRKIVRFLSPEGRISDRQGQSHEKDVAAHLDLTRSRRAGWLVL